MERKRSLFKALWTFCFEVNTKYYSGQADSMTHFLLVIHYQKSRHVLLFCKVLGYQMKNILLKNLETGELRMANQFYFMPSFLLLSLEVAKIQTPGFPSLVNLMYSSLAPFLLPHLVLLTHFLLISKLLSALHFSPASSHFCLPRLPLSQPPPLLMYLFLARQHCY